MSYHYILIVDDEVDICEKLATCFELEDFIVLTAHSGNKAIDILRLNPQVELIVSDIKMPDGDGLKLIDFVKNELDKKVPIIMLSAFSETPEAELLERGALRLISKPVNIDDLISYIKSL